LSKITNLVSEEKKQEYVQKMFSSAARRYDLLNSLLSLGLHHRWKRFAVSQAKLIPGNRAVDICAGTQDIAILLAKAVGKRGQVVAVDLNPDMLALGDQKVARAGLESQITSLLGNAEELPLPDNCFDAATVGFGVRNVTDVERAFSEMRRVVRPGGRVICLEFSHPVSPTWKALYDFYSFQILPRIGQFVSGDKTGIYEYLPKSIRLFPDQENLKKIMEKVGLRETRYFNLSGGIVAVHIGIK